MTPRMPSRRATCATRLIGKIELVVAGSEIMEIINECVKPPYGLMRQVRRSIRWIYPGDLVDLKHVLLIDELPEVTTQSAKWYSEAHRASTAIYGWYKPKDRTPAAITLHVSELYRGIPSLYYWTTVPTLIITSSLAHEVGHHLIAKRGYLFSSAEKLTTRQDEETAVNHYAFSVVKRMRERWYYRAGHWAVRDLADTHYMLGILDWREKKYKEAAEHWHNASMLDPEGARTRVIGTGERKNCATRTRARKRLRPSDTGIPSLFRAMPLKGGRRWPIHSTPRSLESSRAAATC